MSDINTARRTDAEIIISGVNVTDSVKKYLISLTYTDNEADETDDLQIQLADRDSIWLEKWLSPVISAAAATKSRTESEKEPTQYKVTAKSGAYARSRAGTQYYVYGSLAYGTIITAKSESGGWVNFTYSGKNAYVQASCLTKLSSGSSSAGSADGSATKGLRIGAVIVRQNWRSDGKDDTLECGQFELDSITAQGPPSTITIKGTSLPYNSTVRQTLKSKSWEEYNLSGIANEIANKNGMTCMFLSASNPEYTRVEQYRTSDIAFLEKLCHDAGCSLKVSNNIIIVFDQAEYEAKAPIKTISKGKSGGYVKYKLSTDENDMYTSCRVSYTNSKGKTISATAYSDTYDKDSKTNQCLEVKQKVSSESEAKALAEKMLRLHNKYELTASFTFPGDPALVAGCTVLLSGWGPWNGKYIITQAKHKVDGSGYTTQINLRMVLTGGVSSGTGTDSSSDANGGSTGNDSVNGEGTSEYKVGDRVMCNSGVHTFANGKRMQAWVPTKVLYVRRIEKDGDVLLLSTSMDIDEYTGRVYASDVHKVG